MSFVAVAAALLSTASDAKPKKVLMIGNSFSVCVLKQLPQCAADAGCTIDIASLYIGGCPFPETYEPYAGKLIAAIKKPGLVDWRGSLTYPGWRPVEDAWKPVYCSWYAIHAAPARPDWIPQWPGRRPSC